MEVTKKTLVQLGHKWIKKVEDLAEFSEENWKQVTENLQADGGDKGDVGSVGSQRDQESGGPFGVQQGELEA
eukprot:8814019-Ditylum_brightwellii.AAC.1